MRFLVVPQGSLLQKYTFKKQVRPLSPHYVCHWEESGFFAWFRVAVQFQSLCSRSSFLYDLLLETVNATWCRALSYTCESMLPLKFDSFELMVSYRSHEHRRKLFNCSSAYCGRGIQYSRRFIGIRRSHHGISETLKELSSHVASLWS